MKGIPDFSNYFIDKNGRIYSKRYNRYRKPTKNSSGCYIITLPNDSGNRKTLYMHRLVANAFLPNPLNKKDINFKDGNKANYRLSNLLWVNEHSKKTRKYDKNTLSKIKKEQLPSRTLAKMYGGHQTTICRVKKRGYVKC